MPQTTYKNLGLNPNWPRACRRLRRKDSGCKPSIHVFLFCLYGDTLFPFIRSAFSPIGFLARKRFLTRSATFCTSATVRHSTYLLYFPISVPHATIQPHAPASRLRGCDNDSCTRTATNSWISGNHYVDHLDRIDRHPGKGLTMYLNH